MVSNNDKKEIIFILPYLDVNTTSAERFKSFIAAFEENKQFILRIIIIDYNLERSFFSGLEINNSNAPFSNKFCENIKPKLNFIQKLGFRFLKSGEKKKWRLLQLLHLLVYKTDIFYPGNISIQKRSNTGFIFSSGSHFSFFSTASQIAKNLRFDIILDYRDPWTYGYTAIDGKEWVQKSKYFFGRIKEIRYIKQAQFITTVSESLKNFFPVKFHNKILVLPNGSNYTNHHVINETPKNAFNIVYVGTIYNDQLRENIFFHALNKFIKNKDLSQISLKFIGSSQNSNLIKMIKNFKLEEITEITPRLNNNQVLNYLNNASIFLQFKYGNRNDVISSKQAEYLMFRRPILLPISDNGDIAESILKYKAGYVCESESQIIDTLELLWEKFKNGENLFINQPQEFIESISRKKIAEDFARLLTEN
ncbi:hypothetical protein A5893_12085 [Pedobacter psychrophilus]|uniref:Glycosyl transferase family 1 domain-containing protein n=1 Tax=Pedobacter psychrophilus TaxID=1826909 RepID=A0A179DCL2_9SPHI|nr:hypothetical protein [Pedobacter psychrophilus]OAQ38781.1 hypothetical protein A5893_12085 [Pedobacter psychrophilus]